MWTFPTRLRVRNVGATGRDDSVRSHLCIIGALPANMSFAGMISRQNRLQNLTSAQLAEAVTRELSGSLDIHRLFIAAVGNAGICSAAR